MSDVYRERCLRSIPSSILSAIIASVGGFLLLIPLMATFDARNWRYSMTGRSGTDQSSSAGPALSVLSFCGIRGARWFWERAGNITGLAPPNTGMPKFKCRQSSQGLLHRQQSQTPRVFARRQAHELNQRFLYQAPHYPTLLHPLVDLPVLSRGSIPGKILIHAVTHQHLP